MPIVRIGGLHVADLSPPWICSLDRLQCADARVVAYVASLCQQSGLVDVGVATGSQRLLIVSSRCKKTAQQLSNGTVMCTSCRQLMNRICFQLQYRKLMLSMGDRVLRPGQNLFNRIVRIDELTGETSNRTLRGVVLAVTRSPPLTQGLSLFRHDHRCELQRATHIFFDYLLGTLEPVIVQLRSQTTSLYIGMCGCVAKRVLYDHLRDKRVLAMCVAAGACAQDRNTGNEDSGEGLVRSVAEIRVPTWPIATPARTDSLTTGCSCRGIIQMSSWQRGGEQEFGKIQSERIMAAEASTPNLRTAERGSNMESLWDRLLFDVDGRPGIFIYLLMLGA